MAEEQQGGNVARVGLALDSTAFRSGVQRTLADIESLLSGLRKLGSAGSSIGASLLGPGGQSAPLQIARDIQRTTIPALRAMDRQVRLINSSLLKQNQLQASSVAAFTAASQQRMATVRAETQAQVAQLKAQEATRKSAQQARLEESRSAVAMARDTASRLRAERDYLTQLRDTSGSRSYHMPSGSPYPQSVRVREQMMEPTPPSFMPHPSGSGQMGYKYVVVPLKDVVTSKDAGFPGILQPRDRGSRKSEDQIKGIADNPKWNLIFQATDNLERGLATLANVEGKLLAVQGNARTLGTRGFLDRVQGPAENKNPDAMRELNAFIGAQRAFLKANGGQFEGGAAGATADFARIIQSGQAPYIARIVAQTVAELGGMQGLGRIALQANNRGMEPAQEAIAAARLLDRTPNFGPGSAAQLVAKTDLIRSFAAEMQQIVGQGRYQATYVNPDNASNTPEWAKLLERTLAARAFGSDPQTERLLTLAFSGQKGPLASKAFMDQMVKGVGDQLAIRARVEAGHITPEMDPFYQRLGPALQVIADVDKMYGPAVLKDRKPAHMMTRIDAATAGGMAGMLGEIPTDDVKQLAQSIMVAGDKGMPALIKALSVFASRVESPTAPSLFGAAGGTLPMEFGKMLDAAQQSVLAYTQGLADELAKLRQTKPGAKSVAAGKAEEILNTAINGTLQRIAEAYAQQLNIAPTPPPAAPILPPAPTTPPPAATILLPAPTTPPPALTPTNGSPFTKEDALLRGRGEDLRTFGINPRLIGTAPNYDYLQATAGAQAEFNKALMAGMERYRDYVRALANASRVLKSGASVGDSGLPEYYLNSYRTGMPIDKVMAEMKDSMRKIGKILKANYDLLGSRGVLEEFAATTRRAASAQIPPGGPAALAPFGSLPFEGKFDPKTLAYNVPDKLKYTAVGVTGISQPRGEELFAAMKPMLQEYFYSPSQTFNPFQEANVPAKGGRFTVSDIQKTFLRMINRQKQAGLIGVQVRGASTASREQGLIESYPSIGGPTPASVPMGAQGTTTLSLNNQLRATAISLMNTLVHEIAHTSMRAAYGDRAGFYGDGKVPNGVEMDRRFAALQFKIAEREKMSMPMAIEKILGMIGQDSAKSVRYTKAPSATDFLINEAQYAGAMQSHAQQKIYNEEGQKALGVAQFARAQEVAQFIVSTGAEIARAFAQGGQPAAFSSFKDSIIQFAGLTAPMVDRTTYALEAAAKLYSGYIRMPKAMYDQNQPGGIQLGGRTIELLEQALSRMVGTGRMLPYANAQSPKLAEEMRTFVSIAPLEMLQAIHDITRMATGKIKVMEALSGKPGDDLRASLLGLVSDFEKASKAVSAFGTSSELARAQVAAGQPQANAPPSVSNVLPPSSRAPQLPPVTPASVTPVSLGPGGGAGGSVGGGGFKLPGGGELMPIAGGTGGGGGNAQRPGSGGGGGGFSGGGRETVIGGGAFDNFRSWWATNGAQAMQFLKFTANFGVPRFGGKGEPVSQMGAPGDYFNEKYSKEQLDRARQVQFGNRINAAYQATVGSIAPQYQSAYSNYQSGQTSQDARKAEAKRAFVEQQLGAQATASANSRLNMVIRDGHIQFGQLAKAVTATGNGMIFSTLNTLKFATALAFGRQITMTIIQVFDHFRGGIIKFNADLEAAAVGFTTLFKNQGMTMDQARVKTDETINALVKFANVTNFRFGELQVAALRMKAFGFEIDTAAAKAKGQMPILEMIGNAFNPDAPLQFSGAIVNIGDAVAALGAEDDKLRRVTYALGQMNSAGRVYQNDMMQLSNAGIAGYDILSKALLKQLDSDPALKKANAVLYNKLLDPTTAVDAVRQLAKVGKIGGPAAVQAILQGLKETYGGGMAAFAKTFRGAMTTIADTSQFLIATAFKPFFEMVRDQTYQLSLSLQTPAATAEAEKIGLAIKQVTDGIKGGMPGAVKVLLTFGDAFASVVSGFSENLDKPGSTVLGFFDSFAKGLGIVGDILSNQVIGKLVATGVAMKVLTGAMAANPLMATLIAGTALVGFLGNAAETNAFGMKDTMGGFTESVQNALGNTSETLVPTLTAAMGSSLEAIGAILLSAVKTILPGLQLIIEQVSILGGTFQALAPLLGTFFGIWLGKRILIDGIAAAMLKLATAAQAVGSSITNARTAGAMASMFGVSQRRFDNVQQSTLIPQQPIIDPRTLQPLIRNGQPVFAPARYEIGGVGPGKGYQGGPSLNEANLARLQGIARASNAAGVPMDVPRNLTPEQRAAPISSKDAALTMAFLRGQGPKDETPLQRDRREGARAEFNRKVGPEEAKRLASEFANVRDGVRSFGAGLKETFTSVQGFKTGISAAASSVTSNLGTVGGAALGVGIGLTALGVMLNNEMLQTMGGVISQIGLLAMGLNGLAGLLMLFGLTSGWALAIGALLVGLTGLFVAADAATKALKKLAQESPYGKSVAADEEYAKAFTEANPEVAAKIIKEYGAMPDELDQGAKEAMLQFAREKLIERGKTGGFFGTPLDTPELQEGAINKLDEQGILDAYNLYIKGQPRAQGYEILQADSQYADLRYTSPAALQAMREYDLKESQREYNLVYGPGQSSKDASKDPALKKAQDNEIMRLFSTGVDMDSIAKMVFGAVTKDATLRITDAIAAVSGTPESEAALQLLKSSVDTSGKVAQQAATALTKASEAFQKPLNRLLQRAGEVLRAVFEEEKKLLETERSKALDNVNVLYNGETIRLGTLKEQHAALVAQREEVEKLKALEKDRQAAAEAAAAMFDANVDPLQRAVAAREAARTLYDSQGQTQVNNMQDAITAGEASVPFKETVDFYDLKLKQLETDQSERQRRLDERIQDLQKKIDEGKITLAAAKAELNSAFSDAGIDVGVLSDQGSDIGKQFGQGFMDGLQKNLDLTFKNLGAYILAAAKKLRADKDLIAAQEMLAAATEPKTKYVATTVLKKKLQENLGLLRVKQSQLFAKQRELQLDPIKYAKQGPAVNAAGTLLRLEIDRLLLQIENLAGTQYDERYMTGAAGNLDSILAQMNAFLTNIDMPGYDGPRAAGGPIFGNGSYMVGERGPELLKVGKNGQMTIVPNHMLPTYLKSSAGALMAGKMGRMGGFAPGTSGASQIMGGYAAGTPNLVSIVPNHKLRGPGGMSVGGGSGTISASVVINNPQLNSAADIDRLAEKVAAAQTRSLRAMGYARPR